jgi:hypothetical protein
MGMTYIYTDTHRLHDLIFLEFKLLFNVYCLPS